MVVEKEFKNHVEFGHNIQKTYNEAYNQLLNLMNKNLTRQDENFVLIIDYTDDVGVIVRSDVAVSDSYISIANLIASFDYQKNTQVSVYAIQGTEYASIKYKIYDGLCYSSYAGCTVSTYDIHTIARRFWDTNATINY